MNTRFIETFLTLARLGSFRATAREMHATPAAISLRIKALETELGISLIDRAAAPFRLTDQGERILIHARTVVDAARSLELSAQDDTQISARLRLGVIETIVHSWLPDFIRKLNNDFPNIVIDLTVEASAALGARLSANELDLVIQVEGSKDPLVVSTALASYPVRWIVQRDLLPSDAPSLVHAMLQCPVLTFGKGTAPQIAVDAIVTGLAAHNNVPLSETRVTCIPSVAAMIHLLRDGYGVAAVPSLFVAPFLENGELMALTDLPAPPSLVVALCRRSDAGVATLAAARAARDVCDHFCLTQGKTLIETL
ncbi:MAG: LysR family transcriptional regulator [Janthinobacterium lividum]